MEFLRPMGVIEHEKRMIWTGEKRRLELLKKAREQYESLEQDESDVSDMVAFECFLDYYEPFKKAS